MGSIVHYITSRQRDTICGKVTLSGEKLRSDQKEQEKQRATPVLKNIIKKDKL